MYITTMEDAPAVPIAQARANLSDLIARTWHRDEVITLTSRGKPRAALVPHDIAELIGQCGGLDRTREALEQFIDSTE